VGDGGVVWRVSFPYLRFLIRGRGDEGEEGLMGEIGL